MANLRNAHIKMLGILSGVLMLLPCIVLAQSRLSVDIQGVRGELKQNVELTLSIFQQRDDATLNDVRIKRLHERSIQEITQALKPFGYFRPNIEKTLEKKGERWLARYNIELNDALKLTRLTHRLLGEGERDKVFRELFKQLPLKVGEVLDQRQYNAAKLKIQNLAASRGYFDVTFLEHHILVDIEHYESDVILIVNSGPRYTFGDVQINAATPSVHFIKKFIGFQPGQPYSVDALIALQNSLNDSEYFQSVEIEPLIHLAANQQVPIAINLEPRTTRQYSLGLGYGTDTGARMRLGVDAPLINDKGHRFDSSILFSEFKNSFTGHYRVPVLDPRTDEFAYSIAYVDEETVTSKSEVLSLGIGLIHARGVWRETVSLTYQDERFEVGDDSGRSTLLMPGVSWSRIWGKERIYTRKGASLTIDLRAASQYLLSDVDFLQGRSHTKMIYSVTAKGRLIARATAGAILANEFEHVPSSVRFFAGGDNSVRGYKYNSLGPQSADGTVVGGRGLMVASLEYERAVFQGWDGAIFYDIGNAVDFFDEPVKRGAGIGVRWRSPIGPIRLDLAYALSEAGTPWRLHLNLGPDL